MLEHILRKNPEIKKPKGGGACGGAAGAAPLNFFA